MMRKVLGSVTAVALVTSITGCAAIIEGTTQTVTVETPGCPQARCTLDNGNNIYHVTTPGSVSISRTKKDVVVSCKRDGCTPGHGIINSELEYWTLGNLLLGGFIGFGIDFATGAWNNYQGAISIPMRQRDTSAPRQTPMSRGGSRPSLSPSPNTAPMASTGRPSGYRGAAASSGVSLGYYLNDRDARTGWELIKSDFPGPLSKGAHYEIKPVQAPQGRTLYYLYGRGMTAEDAQRLCNQMHARGAYCAVE